MPLLQVIDARGETQMVYNLRAWHRSRRARRDFPEPLFREICRRANVERCATGVESRTEEEQERKPDPQARAKGVAIGALVALGGLIYRGQWNSLTVLCCVIALLLAAFCLLAPRELLASALSFRVTSPLEWCDAGQIARAIVSCGCCAACAQSLESARVTRSGVLICRGCGAAWRTPDVESPVNCDAGSPGETRR